MPISIRDCLATCQCAELSVPGGLRTGRSGGTEVLPLMAGLESRIHDNIYISSKHSWATSMFELKYVISHFIIRVYHLISHASNILRLLQIRLLDFFKGPNKSQLLVGLASEHYFTQVFLEPASTHSLTLDWSRFGKEFGIQHDSDNSLTISE